MDNSQPKSTDSQFLSFHDFASINQAGNTEEQLGIESSTHQSYNNLSRDPVNIIEDLQGIPDKSENNFQHSFWTIEYYQKFFNINTNDVLERLKRSMIPHGRDNYFITHIRPNPDLYGPFWICMTLIFSLAISGNVANYLNTDGSIKFHWKYDFHVVSYAATCIFLYAWLLPLALWGMLKWTNTSRNTEEELLESYSSPKILELLCLYGYSLTIYIPVTFLWTIQVSWLQWCIALIATFLSGGVLLRSLLPVIAAKHRIIYIAVILGMHIILTAGFMLYYFHGPFKSILPTTSELIPSPTQINVLHMANMSQRDVAGISTF